MSPRQQVKSQNKLRNARKVAQPALALKEVSTVMEGTGAPTLTVMGDDFEVQFPAMPEIVFLVRADSITATSPVGVTITDIALATDIKATEADCAALHEAFTVGGLPKGTQVVYSYTETKMVEDVPTAPEPIGSILVRPLHLSETNASYRSGKGSISQEKFSDFFVTRISADKGLGVTFNFKGPELSNVDAKVICNVQGFGTQEATLSNVAGGIGFVVEDAELADAIIEVAQLSGSFGLELELVVTARVKPAAELAFNPDVRPDIFRDEDELVDTYLSRLWVYVRAMYPGFPHTPKEIENHQTKLINLLDNVTELDTELFGVVMVSFEAVFVAYEKTVFAENYIARGVAFIKPQAGVNRLLALMNTLRIVCNTNNSAKLHLLLDLSNLHLHGFGMKQTTNLVTYFNIVDR